MTDDDKQPRLAKEDVAHKGRTARQADDVSSAGSSIKRAEEAPRLVPAPSDEVNNHRTTAVSEEILNYVQDLQNKNIERLEAKIASPSAIDRRIFFSKFSLVLVGFVLCAIFFKPITGVRLATHAAMAPLLTEEQALDARWAYADFLVETGKSNEAISIYYGLAERIKAKHGNSQSIALINFNLAHLLLSAEPLKAKELLEQALADLTKPNENTPKSLVETLRRMAITYMDNSDPTTAYAVAQTASKFWKTGPTKGSEGNLFSDIGWAFSEKGEWQLSYDCYAHAFAITESWGDSNFNVYRLNQMAIAKSHLKQPEEAAPLFQRAIAMERKINHGKLYYTAGSIPIVARCLMELNKPQEAIGVINLGLPSLAGDWREQALEQLAYAYLAESNEKEVDSVINRLEESSRDWKTGAKISEIKKALREFKKRVHTGQ